MPNYVNRLVDPSEAMTGSLNALSVARSARQQDTANEFARRGLDMDERRLKLQERSAARQDKTMAKQDFIDSIQIPMQFQQMKSKNMADIAMKISAMPASSKTARYKDLVTIVAKQPIAEHADYGPLGVVDPSYYMDPETFGSLSEDQQDEYLKMLAYDSDALAKLDLSKAEGYRAAEKIALEHDAKLNEIMFRHKADLEIEQEKGRQSRLTAGEKGRQDRLTDKAKDGGKGESPKQMQDRIDKYHKEISNLASVRERIRRGDDLYNMGQMMASFTGNNSFGMDKDTSVTDALKKVDEYETWLRQRLRSLELNLNLSDSDAKGNKGGKDKSDPLGFFKSKNALKSLGGPKDVMFKGH